MKLLVSALATFLILIAAPVFAASDDYRIHPGDTLAVTIYGEPNLPVQVKVLQGGTIAYPLAGEVHVGGMTQTAAAAALAHALAKYIREPNVTISVATEGPLRILVLGNVKTPGKYELAPGARLTDALASAGGLGAVDGAFPDARLAAADGAVTQISLQALLQQGNTTLNAPLTDEMTVYVPSPQLINVQILGAVDKPGDITVHEGDRLSTAIARAGDSATANGDLNNITLRRVLPGGVIQNQTVNLYEVLHSGDLNKDPVLQKNDFVYVPKSKSKANAGDILYGIGRLFGLP
jgi:polysaccharide export outer membrane protein